MPNTPLKCLVSPTFVSLVLLLSCSCMAATGVSGSGRPYKPLIVPVTKDTKTSLYTIAIKNDAPLVVDLAGTLVWSTCPSTHSTVPCMHYYKATL
ncbi:hypothetical protein GUJ93_ZPchr0007g3297 [Zizania palustris]|uniref:Xylanase inhibitor N-terminal domain-containing protein n=1 Tax=Zizania palustris TaxID=103762 RepID=A0A8J5VNQ2_ZIZPA|nr:hypothetical protein GUJ93_ZPchr0007g3297 [Zizania palustris]